MEGKTFRGMHYRRLGHSGLWVSEVGLGMWKWGDPTYDGSRVGEHAGFEILDRALELGITHWDTANSYNAGSGNCERLLGRYFAQRGSRTRDKVVLATKVRNSVRPEHKMMWGFTPNESGASRKYIVQAVEGCLRRLQTDRIDLLYHHAPDLLPDGSWATPLDETWAAFDQLLQQGKVLYLAVSNRSLTQLAEEQKALAAVAANSAHRIVGLQNRYNMLERARVASSPDAILDDEKTMLDGLLARGVGLIPYMPLAVGLLTGRYRKGRTDTPGRLSEEALGTDLLTERNLSIVEELIAIAEEKGCTLAQLALAWLLAQPAVCSVIAGVTRMAHLEDNAQATKIKLHPEDLTAIRSLTG